MGVLYSTPQQEINTQIDENLTQDTLIDKDNDEFIYLIIKN